MGQCNDCTENNIPTVNEEALECCEFYPADCVKTTEYNSFFKIGVGKSLTFVIEAIAKSVKKLYDKHNYKEWVGFVSQTGISDPTSVVIKNELSGPLSFVRTGAGKYTATLTGAFTADKTIITLGSFNKAWGSDIICYRVDDDTLSLETGSSTDFIDDDVIADLPLVIKVYN